MSIEIIDQLLFEPQSLAESYPPKLHDRNKLLIHEIATSSDLEAGPSITYSSWRSDAPQGAVDAAAAANHVVSRDGWYDYAVIDDGGVEWHVNFADAELFFGYAGSLFAQDEVQVAEHPALASVREALLANKLEARTHVNGAPTPVLITNVPRRCAIDTSEIYGTRFARPLSDTIRRAVRQIDPPTLSNIIAMAAPARGVGQYTREQIRSILETAYTAFRAAVITSGELRATINTGYWGCGAFGGNRTVMAMLQMLASHLASVHALVFHTGFDDGPSVLDDAIASMRRALSDCTTIDDAIELIEGLGYRWGVSDGN